MNSRNGNTADSSPVRIVPPYPHTYTLRVKAVEAGMPIVRFMEMRFPFRTGDEWSARMEAGLITCNDLAVSGSHILETGDEISHHNPCVKEPSVPDSVRIVRETDEYLIAFKPAPMPVHQGGRYFRNTLVSILNEMGRTGLNLVHRLDSVTSGLLLIAKNPAAAAKIHKKFQDGEVKKEYTALVSGIPTEDHFECDKGIIREKGYRFSCSDARSARNALTRFEVIKRGAARSLIRCLPVTGRTHQIRLHLQACGFPIANDPFYGPDEALQSAQNSAIFLMHTALEIPSLSISAEVPIPNDWMLALNEKP